MPGPTYIAPYGSSFGAESWGLPVATPAALPAVGIAGVAHVVLDDGDGKTAIYVWNPLIGTWEKVADPDFTTGGGDVTGPTGSVNNGIVVFDGVTGKLIKEATGWYWDPIEGNLVSPSGDAVLTSLSKQYSFSLSARVPSNGLRYLNYGLAFTSSIPLKIFYAGVLSKLSISVNSIDVFRNYELRILIDGLVVESIVLLAGTSDATSGMLTTPVSYGNSISVLLVRTAGSGASSFRRASVSLEIS